MKLFLVATLFTPQIKNGPKMETVHASLRDSILAMMSMMDFPPGSCACDRPGTIVDTIPYQAVHLSVSIRDQASFYPRFETRYKDMTVSALRSCARR